MQFAQLENVGIMYAARKACTYIKKFKGRISNSLDHNRIILLAIEVFYLFVRTTPDGSVVLASATGTASAPVAAGRGIMPRARM